MWSKLPRSSPRSRCSPSAAAARASQDADSVGTKASAAARPSGSPPSSATRMGALPLPTPPPSPPAAPLVVTKGAAAAGAARGGAGAVAEKHVHLDEMCRFQVCSVGFVVRYEAHYTSVCASALSFHSRVAASFVCAESHYLLRHMMHAGKVTYAASAE